MEYQKDLVDILRFFLQHRYIQEIKFSDDEITLKVTTTTPEKEAGKEE